MEVEGVEDIVGDAQSAGLVIEVTRGERRRREDGGEREGKGRKGKRLSSTFPLVVRRLDHDVKKICSSFFLGQLFKRRTA